MTAEAGAWVPGLARKAMLAGLVGLEHTIGIPGTLGGLVLMNGGSQRQRNRRQSCVGSGLSITRGSRSSLRGRSAHFPIVRVPCRAPAQSWSRWSWSVNVQQPQQIRQLMLEDLRERRRKFPRKQPNCGSVFLSTSEMHASVGPPGKVIEEAGLKGVRIGNAEVSRQHANFIVNLGGATSKDVLSLIAHIRQVVHDRIGFDLCCEVRYVSPAGEIMPAHLASV